MTAAKTPKTLRERELELRALLRTPEGEAELERLADRYALAGGGIRGRTSLVTYILVHERVRGVIRL
jgi:hypothetical protein